MIDRGQAPGMIVQQQAGTASTVGFPRPLRANFMERDAHLVVDPQGQYIIFDSQSRPRIGDCRLFISFKEKDDRWTKPASLGRYIKQRAALAWISYDGEYIFYKAGDDVYWVSAAKLIEKVKPENTK